MWIGLDVSQELAAAKGGSLEIALLASPLPALQRRTWHRGVCVF
jgi:hypothetical protein